MNGWWVLPGQGRVTVDDATLTGIDCSSVPNNIYLIQMLETKGEMKGEILYNHSDRVPVREKFTDISPYIPLFNQWMNAAQSSPPGVSPPVTLTQAQTVKITMVNALFHSKRQAPITSGGQTYDASDENVSNMQSQAISELSSTETQTRQGIANLQNSMNASISDWNSRVANHDAYVSTYGTDVANFNSSLNTQVGTINSNSYQLNANFPASINGAMAASTVTVSGTAPSGGGAISATGTFNPYPVPNQGLSDIPYANAPSINLYLGGMSYVSGAPSALSPSATQTALTAIMNRRNTLKTTQTTKTSDINGLTSVAAVAAYDITSGW